MPLIQLLRPALYGGFALFSGTAAGGGQDPPPGADEPIFEEGVDATLHYDDWSSYSNNVDLTDGDGDFTYTARLNNLMSIETGSPLPPGQSKKLRFAYAANGQDILLDCELDPPNSGAATQFVYTFYFRQLGSSPDTCYTGKLWEFLHGNNERLLMHISPAPPYPNGEASGGSQGESTSMATTYWENLDPFAPLDGDTPSGFTFSPTMNQDDLALPGGLGYAYKQMMGENTLGDFRTYICDTNFHRFTIRITRGPEYGRDSYEGWIDGVKFAEYLGNNGAREEFDKVYAALVTDSLIENLHLGGPSNENGVGPFNTVEYGPIRVWVPA